MFGRWIDETLHKKLSRDLVKDVEDLR